MTRELADNLTAIALAINPSTLIAELLGTPAPHMVASHRLLHPVLAERTLLEFLPFHELHE